MYALSIERGVWKRVIFTMNPYAYDNSQDTLSDGIHEDSVEVLNQACIGDAILSSKILCTRNAESIAVHQANW